ncbi:MAG TPA: DUF4232 domain-containing protein [Mycobacteriales bacterium]|nr:DUF4232 domain-containing protein [Mycobacteriales bacterium]
MKTRALTVSLLALVAAGCGSQAATHTTTSRAVSRPAAQPARLVAVVATTTPTRCTVDRLSLRLGAAGHAAGSTYRPIVFTNTGTTACTLRGYPGVSYVAPRTGAQVGAAASRDTAIKVQTVTLAPGGHAASLVQFVNYLNYPASSCAAKPVSGLRVYPPGSTAAVYLGFAHVTKACSSHVHQLSVRAVLKGRTGQ